MLAARKTVRRAPRMRVLYRCVYTRAHRGTTRVHASCLKSAGMNGTLLRSARLMYTLVSWNIYCLFERSVSALLPLWKIDLFTVTVFFFFLSPFLSLSLSIFGRMDIQLLAIVALSKVFDAAFFFFFLERIVSRKDFIFYLGLVLFFSLQFCRISGYFD